MHRLNENGRPADSGEPGVTGISRCKAVRVEPRRSMSHRDAIGRSAQAVILIVALLGFLCQAIFVQAHFHAPAQAPSFHSAVVTHAKLAVHDDHPGHDEPTDCPICHELAHASAYLLPGSSSFGIPAPFKIWMGPAPLVASVTVRRSHAWRSRAPPLNLQA